MSILKKFVGQTAIYGISTVLSRLLNFILTPIYTRTYPAVTYGIFTTLYAYSAMINAILAFGMESTFFRYLNKHEDKKQLVYNNSFLCVAFIALLFLITGIIFNEPIAIYLSNGADRLADYKSFVQYFLWILFVDAICVIPFAKLRADQKAFRYSLIKFLNIGCFVFMNLIFIFLLPMVIRNHWPMAEWLESWYRHQWIGYVFLSNLIASIVTLLLLLPEISQLQLKFDRPLFAKMIAYSWPILIANLSFIVNENLGRIALSGLLEKSAADKAVGILGAVSKIAVFMSIFITAFRLGAEPFFFSHARNANARQNYAVILYYFVIALSILFIALVANIEMLKYFISGRKTNIAEYWDGLQAVPFLLFGYVCLGVYMNLSVWYRLSDMTKFGLYISGIGAVLTIVLNFMLIPKYGYMGSVWVSMTVYFAMMILSYILGQKYYPIPYKLKSILAYLMTSVVIVTLSFWVFNRNIYIGNSGLLLFLAGVIYFEKDQLKLLLKK
ncbi:lipopolysaccharide biosynthesis protein [Pedobacter caeni]|uniref:Membrane protein involved in the export of O-antigen and teichoic acid n=1 Tax=Pedobacter caeni TaxID=288992 RepID=A0A1M4UL88_9SPHI|nr:polysaccharide biosynthesis C-terminal domain-containing protein [Pedobacter caeni]SHE57333.1 Membrane protein involved in the export of O-antigen and teichoic acid [Pedobacter caeni]